MSSITVRHDLRGRLGPARDQGGRETCLAFAMSDAHAAAIGKPWVPLCCEYLFYHAKQRDKAPADQGTTITAIRAALKHDGQPIETAWPYLSDLPADLTKWKPPAKVEGAKGDTGSLVGIMVKMGDLAFGSRILRISRYGRTVNETAKASINRLEAGAGDRVDGDCIPGPMSWPSPASRWDLPTGGLGVWTHELGQDHRRASER